MATTCTSLKTLLLAVITTTKTASSFTATAPSYKRTSRKKCTVLHATSSNSTTIKKAYNDNALFSFHIMTQAQKIRDYSAMDTFVNTQSLWNLAWHDSFVRNGLSDFVPPMCDELNVLVIGERNWGKYAGEGIDVFVNDEDELAVSTGHTALIPEADEDEEIVPIDALNYMQKSGHDVSSSSFLATIFAKDISHKRLNNDEANNKNDALDLTLYDCIMDQGLIADLICSPKTDDRQTKHDMARLLYEATKRIREMGIYVANTPPMSRESKDYMQYLGALFGLQWEFDLDGISDENTSVNVARKFGTCPEIGWQTLARMIEEAKSK